MTSNRISVIAAALAAAIPAAAIAKPDLPSQAQNHGNGQAQSHGKGQGKAKNAVFKGTVVSTDTTAGSLVVHVLKVNHWSKSFKDTDVTFTVATVKRINVADTNGDGARDLSDVKVGDPVLVQARITKDAVQPFAARKLIDQATDGTDAPDAPVQTSSAG
jgi:hypothetical protein